MKARWSIPVELRVRLVALAMLAGFLFLGAMLWRIQVMRGHFYAQDLEKQSVRRVRLPGMRGRILDRHDTPLADNRPSYAIALYLEELQQPGRWSKTIDHVEGLLARIGKVIGKEADIDREQIEIHFRRRLPLPLLAWRDITPEMLARWAEQIGSVPGVDVTTEAVRVYPHGTEFAHVVGYVGRADPARESDEPFHYYLPEMDGRFGIERSYDAHLRGEAGGQLVRVDVSGYRREDPSLDALTREPTCGRDVRLTLDARVQQLLVQAFGVQPGAGAVLDPWTGDILGLYSAPSFDPNRIGQDYQTYLSDENRPLVDRAVSGMYAPGSVFKPVVAFAALANRKVPVNQRFDCPGWFVLGGIQWQCAHRTIHGTLDMREAIARSCNVYFYKLGLHTGYDPIYYMADALGLGHRTGLPLHQEKSGLLPDDYWMRGQFGHGWRQGDTVNASIGQGSLTVTPLQMAQVTAIIASGGNVFRPRLVMATIDPETGTETAFPPEPVKDMNWSSRTLSVVQGGMEDAVMKDYGTGIRARVPGVRIAAKTGTAEFGPRDDNRYRGWMIAYAPADHPRYAIAVVVDEALSGGSSAGPIVQSVFQGLLGHGAPGTSVSDRSGPAPRPLAAASVPAEARS